jgi:hypothetical protein
VNFAIHRCLYTQAHNCLFYFAQRRMTIAPCLLASIGRNYWGLDFDELV